jgi:hypothetical protein
VALSTAEAELLSMLAGMCEMPGVSQMRRWMLAEVVGQDMKVVGEIIGSTERRASVF